MVTARQLAGQLFTLACLAGLLLFYLLPAVHASRFRYSLNYNEGWNVQKARAWQRGERLYREPPGVTPTNYPPLSFLAVAGAAHFTRGDTLWAGRLLSYLGLLLVGVGAGYTVGRETGSKFAGAAGGLAACLSILSLTHDYVGVSDPQLLGHGIALTGLALWMANQPDGRRSGQTAGLVLIVLSLFCKHNLLALPMAVLTGLWANSQRRQARWALVVMTITGTALLAAVWLFTGPHLLDHLQSARTYSAGQGFMKTTAALRYLLVPLAIALAGLLVLPRAVLDWRLHWIVYSLALSAFFSGGSGTARNMYFELAIALSMYAAAQLAVPGRWEPVLAKPVSAPLLMLVLLLGPLTHAAEFREFQKTPHGQHERDHLAAVAYLRQIPGPWLCEDLLVCADAGQQLVFDPFNSTELFRRSPEQEQPWLERLRRHEIRAVEIDGVPADSLFPAAHERFTARFLATLRQHYTQAASFGSRQVFLPKSSPPQY